MIDFRKAEGKDLCKVRHIAFATWPDTFGSMLPAVQIDYMLNLIYHEESLRQQAKQEHQFILAEKDGVAIGFSSYEINYKASLQFMIHKLYLLPSVQGLGIGTQLLNHLTEIARLNKNTMLRLKVFHLNLKAIKFYVKHGFRKAGTEVTQFKNNYAILDFVLVKEF